MSGRSGDEGMLLDASMMYSGIVGRPDGPSVTIMTTVLLGGLQAITTENGMEELRRRLFSHENKERVKLSPKTTEEITKKLRAAPSLTIHPFISAQEYLTADYPQIAENKKDGYLLAAINHYSPSCLLTFDKWLLELGTFSGVPIVTPGFWLSVADATNP